MGEKTKKKFQIREYMSKIISINDHSFEKEVLESNNVLVDFWAPWCGPCKMTSIILEEIAEYYDKKIKVVKINVDENKETPSNYEIRSIPTIILFKKGKKIITHVGTIKKTT